MGQKHDNTNLPAGSRVDQYVVERKLGGGGFSIVYLARQSGSGGVSQLPMCGSGISPRR